MAAMRLGAKRPAVEAAGSPGKRGSPKATSSTSGCASKAGEASPEAGSPACP
eukprot:gene547-820_t